MRRAGRQPPTMLGPGGCATGLLAGAGCRVRRLPMCATDASGRPAAAYNAGPGRVRDWLAGRRGLPRETAAYVRLVTGQSAEQWTGAKAGAAEMHVANTVPCRQIAGLFARPPAVVIKPADPWGVELVP